LQILTLPQKLNKYKSANPKNGVSKLPVKLSEPKTYVLETAIYYFLIPENTNLETGPNNGGWSLSKLL
jgi:hypothetical protein